MGAVSQKRKTRMPNIFMMYGRRRRQSEMGESDPLTSSSSTIQPSKTSDFIGIATLCVYTVSFFSSCLAILLLVQYCSGVSFWKLLDSEDNQDLISTNNTTSSLPLSLPVDQD